MMRMMGLAIFGTIACGGTPSSKPCVDVTEQRPRDVCYYDLLVAVPAEAPEEAVLTAQSIVDPVIKSAGVLEWIRRHNRSVAVEGGQKLCDQLQNWERTACERRLYAAHLQR